MSTPGTPAGLRWAARPVDGEELAAFREAARARGRVLERDGLELLALGTVARLPLPGGLADTSALPGALELLRSVREPDLGTGAPAGSGPRALAALPFDPATPSALVVPERLVVARPEGAHLTVVATAARLPRLLAAPLPRGERPAPAPDRFSLWAETPHADFLERVVAARDEVRSGRLDKVVLARSVLVRANRPFVVPELVERLRRLYPSCLTFSVDGLIGASPELLVRREGDLALSHPLAGTAARSGDPVADAEASRRLLSSIKDRREHAAVVEAVVERLRPLSCAVEAPAAPSLVELRNVTHLGTLVSARLRRRSGGEPPSALDIVAALHPTPAVAGAPLETALEYLAKAEELHRDRYAGPVGWLDASGDGEWHLAIRCALVAGRRARLFAGAGIVDCSDPEAELAETQLKLQALLSAAVRP